MTTPETPVMWTGATVADVEYERDHQGGDGVTDDEAAQRGQDRYERTVLGWGCD